LRIAVLGALQVDETKLKGYVGEVVQSSVEETLNALLEEETDEICGAQRYERSADRVDTRAGHYEWKLRTKAGAVTLKMPKLRRLPFETAIMRLNQKIYRPIEAWA
jgi:putative transposase